MATIQPSNTPAIPPEHAETSFVDSFNQTATELFRKTITFSINSGVGALIGASIGRLSGYESIAKISGVMGSGIVVTTAEYFLGESKSFLIPEITTVALGSLILYATKDNPSPATVAVGEGMIFFGTLEIINTAALKLATQFMPSYPDSEKDDFSSEEQATSDLPTEK